MMNFWYNGDNFKNVAGADSFVLGKIGFQSPTRDFESVKIPGRNAPLTVDNNRWNTVEGHYQCFIQSGYGNKKHALWHWLDQNGGAFGRLEDDNEPSVYRMARFNNPVREIKVLHDDIARFDVYFECSAEKWLKSGEEVIALTSAGTITNPTTHVAKPLIVVYGSGAGTLTINGHTVSISEIGTSVVLDSEIERAYNGSTPRDSTITGSYHALASGENAVSFSGGVTSVEITPRWWTI